LNRAAWDAARDLGIPIAGWVPRGRLAEDGRIPEVYPHLREAGSEDYAERTARNAHDSDATLILYRGTLSGGSAFTHGEALRLGRPVLAVELSGVQPRDQLPQVRASHSRLRWRRRQDWLGH
jgi:hypothetical protein